MRKVSLILIISIIFIAAKSKAQDPVFSQYYHNPLYTNAALIGSFNAKYRVGINYRTQWFSIASHSSFNTANIYFDAKYNVLKKDYLSLGGMVVDDRAGQGLKLGRTHGYAGLSYAKHLSYNKYNKTNQYLVFGIEAGYGKIFLDYSGYLFGIQFNKTTQEVNENLPIDEELLSSKVFPDINLGLMWYFTKPGQSFFIAMGVAHINTPDISLLDGNTNELYRRYHLYTGGEFSLSKGLYVLPSIYINKQGPATMLIAGNNFRIQYNNADGNAFRIGIWTQLSDDIDKFSFKNLIFSSILELNNAELGLSYDISLGELSNLNNRKGAIEISLMYIWGKKHKRSTVTCPRF